MPEVLNRIIGRQYNGGENVSWATKLETAELQMRPDI